MSGGLLQGAFTRLRAEPRALAGLLVLAGLAALAVLMEFDDRLAIRAQEVSMLESQLARWRSSAAQTHWPAAMKDGRVRMAEFRARAWREESEGRIQASFQDWLRETLGEQTKVSELSVSLPQAHGENLPDDMRLVRARLVAEFASESTTAFLGRLATQERWLWVERLAVKNHPRQRMVEIELVALFALGLREGT